MTAQCNSTPASRVTIPQLKGPRPRNLLEYFLRPGLSVRILLIAWTLSAFLSQEYLLSNWLDVLRQERLEDPVETVQDVVNRGLRFLAFDQSAKDLISSGPFPELADRTGMVQLSSVQPNIKPCIAQSAITDLSRQMWLLTGLSSAAE